MFILGLWFIRYRCDLIGLNFGEIFNVKNLKMKSVYRFKIRYGFF